jgi:N-acetylglutamate synthase-like GNAT family acetyltransferase
MGSDGFTKKACATIIKESIQDWERYGIGSFAVINKCNQTVVGWAGYKRWKDEGHELLCVLSPSCWGIGFEIANRLINYAFNQLRLSSLLILLPKTRNSFQYNLKMGFEERGTEQFKDARFKKFIFKSL